MTWRVEVFDRRHLVRLAIARSPVSPTRRRVLRGEETLAFSLAWDDPARAYLYENATLRLQREGVAGEFTAWRVTSHARKRGEAGDVTLQVAAAALWGELEHGLVHQVMADGRRQRTFGLLGVTPRMVLEEIVLPAVEADAALFIPGEVELDTPVDLDFDNTNPLAALRALEDALQESASAGEVEFELGADGRTYTLHLRARIGQDRGARIEYGANVRGIERTVQTADLATRVYASGGGLLTLADARWTVSSVVGGMVGFSGPSPVHVDDAFTSADRQYWLYTSDGLACPILPGSTAADGRLHVGPGLSLLYPSPGDVAWIARTITGAPLDYLESPLAVEDWGVRTTHVRFEDVPDAINPIPNADLNEVAGGLPAAGWEVVGEVVPEETTDRLYARAGERAWRIAATAEEQGLLSPEFEVQVPADRPYTSMVAGLWIESGRVRVELRHSGGGVYPLSERAASEGVGVYVSLSAGPVHDEPLPAGSYRVAILSHADAAEFYVDSVMVTPTIAGEVPAFVLGSGAHVLWSRAAAELAKLSRPRLEYDVRLVDLAEVDQVRFACRAIELGDDVHVEDPEFPGETLRVTELQDVLDDPGLLRAAVSSGRDGRLYDPYAPGSSARRPGPGSYGAVPRPQDHGEARSLIGFSERARAADSATLAYAWEGTGPLVRYVWYREIILSQPHSTNVRAALRGARAKLRFAPGPGELTIQRPARNTILHGLVTPLTADYREGPSKEITVYPLDPGPPTAEFDHSESATVGTRWWRVQEHGLPVTSTEIEIQVGKEPPAVSTIPTRGPGDPSVVRPVGHPKAHAGGLLGDGEYEVDVALVSSGMSWVRHRFHYPGGVYSPENPPFDRNKLPNILGLDAEGKRLKGTGDSEVRSWLHFRLNDGGDPWSIATDGHSTNVYVPVPDGEEWEVETRAFAVAADEVTATTFYARATRVLRGVGVTTPPTLTVAITKPEPGGRLITIEVTAIEGDDPLGDFDLRLHRRFAREGGAWSSSEEIGAAVDPPAGVLSAASAHAYDVGAALQRLDGVRMHYEVTAEAILRATGSLREARPAEAIWEVQDFGTGVPVAPEVLA